MATTQDERDSLWKAYRGDGGSHDAASRLLVALLPLVHKVLRRMLARLPSNVAPEDLLQVGAIALWRILPEYDAERGVSFDAFAYRRIHGAMLDYLRSEDRVPRSCRDRLAEIESIMRAYLSEQGRLPADAELAHAAGMTTAQLDRLMERARPWLSLDEILDGGGDVPMDSELPSPGKQVETAQRCGVVRQSLLLLDAREQKILYLYYYQDLTFAEIAVLYELTEARISQIHALAVVKLRAILSETLKE